MFKFSFQNFKKNSSINNAFKPYSNNALHGCVATSKLEELRPALNQLNNLLVAEKLVKNSIGTTAGFVTISDTTYFLKRYNNRSWVAKVKNSLRLTRPFKVLLTSFHLSQLNIYTPTVFAALEKRSGLFFKNGYLLTETLPSQMLTASKALPHLAQNTDSENLFIETLCSKLALMHNNGISHGDAKMSNVLVSYDDATNKMTVGFLDLDGSKLNKAACSQSIRIKEVARVASSLYKVYKSHNLASHNLASLCKKVATAYQAFSNIYLPYEAVLKRTTYLAMRVRKK